MSLSSNEYLQITYHDSQIQEAKTPANLPFCNSELYTKHIKDYVKLTSGPDVKDVYECTLDISDIYHDFFPGDAIGILPHNNIHEVNLLLELLNLNELNYKLSLIQNTTKKKAILPHHIPAEGSIVHLFMQCLDIRSIPKKAFLKMLAQHTANQDERNELLMLSQPKEPKYESFILNEGRSLLTLLIKFPSCKPPLQRLLEHLPQLKPRFYSISSSAVQTISITFSVIDLFHACSTVLRGVCSSYLQTLLLEPSAKRVVCFYFRQPSNFLCFAPEFNHPLILIGPGTGVAPFRYLLQRQSQFKTSENRPNKVYLFFGCRYNSRDFLFKDELFDFVESGILTALYAAFSREKCGKRYVQDVLLEQGQIIADLLLHENASLRLCGDARNLTKAVDNVLGMILRKFGALDDGECSDFLTELKLSSRYRIDSWM